MKKIKTDRLVKCRYCEQYFKPRGVKIHQHYCPVKKFKNMDLLVVSKPEVATENANFLGINKMPIIFKKYYVLGEIGILYNKRVIVAQKV